MNKPSELTQLILDALKIACTDLKPDKEQFDKMIIMAYRIRTENLNVSLKSRDG